MFKKTRLELTAWYLLIIMLISASFSLFIYEMLSREVERFALVQHFRIERRFRQNALDIQLLPPVLPQEELDLVDESKQRIIAMLGAVNVVILIFSGVLGYFLAGKTLYPIQAMLDEQNRFISDASHEFRTPLTSLKTAMEVAMRDKKMDLPQAKELIKDSISEANKLQQLTEDLLQFTQHTNAGDFKLEQVKLNDLIKVALHRIEPLAKNKQITIEDTIDMSLVTVNKKGIIDILVILLDNAIKYSPSKSFITLSSKQTEKHTYFLIQDQGLGIAEKDIPHVFDRFYRSDSARVKYSSKGFGLGLSIAKRIVDLHKGTISVKSNMGKGSLFTVVLPRIPKNSV